MAIGAIGIARRLTMDFWNGETTVRTRPAEAVIEGLASKAKSVLMTEAGEMIAWVQTQQMIPAADAAVKAATERLGAARKALPAAEKELVKIEKAIKKDKRISADKWAIALEADAADERLNPDRRGGLNRDIRTPDHDPRQTRALELGLEDAKRSVHRAKVEIQMSESVLATARKRLGQIHRFGKVCSELVRPATPTWALFLAALEKGV